MPKEAFYPQEMHQQILANENEAYKQSPDSRHFRVFSETQVHEAIVCRFHPGLQADCGPAEYIEYPFQCPEYPEYPEYLEYPEYNDFTTTFQNCVGFQDYSQETQSSVFTFVHQI